MTNKRLIQTTSARKVIGPTVGPSQRHSGLEHTRILKGSEPCQIQGSPYKKATIYSGGRNPVLTITYKPEQQKSIVLSCPVGHIVYLYLQGCETSENETITNQLHRHRNTATITFLGNLTQPRIVLKVDTG